MHIRIDKKSYGENLLLRDVEFDLNPGHGVAFLGRSGIGKSTILRIVAGLDQDFAGEVSGRVERVGMAFQEPFLMNWRSALENLTLMTSCTGEAARAALGKMELEGLEDRLPNELSLGQQRRVSLARALVGEPELLILDEAFASLDKKTEKLMLEVVQDFVKASNCRLVMATHHKADLILAKTIYTIQDGYLQQDEKWG